MLVYLLHLVLVLTTNIHQIHLGAAAELINLGVNAGIGMKMSDTLDVGVAMTITYAMLEAGLTGSGGMTHDIGFRGTLGARKIYGSNDYWCYTIKLNKNISMITFM